MPNRYFVGEPEKSVSGGVTTYVVPQDGAVRWTDSAGTELFSITSAARAVKTNAGAAPVASFTFSPATNGANVCEVTITAKDASGATLARADQFIVWLSDSAVGTGLTATTASGAVAAKTSNGTDFAVLTTKKAILVQSLATGVYVLSITDSAKTAFYVCASTIGQADVPSVSAVLATGNYG